MAANKQQQDAASAQQLDQGQSPAPVARDDMETVNILLSIAAAAVAILAAMYAVAKWIKSKFLSRKKDEFIVFRSDTDPAFQETLCKLIESAASEIVFIGLGHTMLRHNDHLRNTLKTSLETNRALRIDVFFAAQDNPALQRRVVEEDAHIEAKIGPYDREWPKTHFEWTAAFCGSVIPEACRSRIAIHVTRFFPMFYLIKIDGEYLFYMYGTPDTRGPDTPWFYPRGLRFNQTLRRFFDDIITFTRANSDRAPTEAKG